MEVTVDIPKEAIQGEEVGVDDFREEDVPSLQVPSMDALLGDIYELRF